MKSRFLNVSPRVYIRQKDAVNVLSAQSPFKENISTIIFKENQVLLAPYMIPGSKAAASGFLTGNLYVTGNYQDSSAYLDRNITFSEISPYADKGACFENFSDEDEGFPESALPGFSSPTSDKLALNFNISSTQDISIIKLNKGDSLKDASGEFFNQEGSGFLYFSNGANRWVDVGYRDPYTGLRLSRGYDPVLSLSSSADVLLGYHDILDISPKNTVGQFGSSPYSITSEGPYYIPNDVNALKARGYDRIGEPTSFFGAPEAPRYHARDNLTFKVSDVVSYPVAIDRISVKFPVTAYRSQIPCTGSEAVDSGFGRDIDNYVFFVYLQNRSNATTDSISDISSSIRYLIGKESFCVYNQDTLNEVSSGLAPIHNYGQSIPFSMAKDVATTTSGTIVSLSKDAEINMTFRPSTFNSTFGATSKHPASTKVISGSGYLITGSVFIQNFWRGGQISIGAPAPTSRISGTFNLNSQRRSTSPNQDNLLATPSPRSLIGSFWSGTPSTFISGSGFSIDGTSEFSTSSTFESIQSTPIVIFPGDELIFGIESGANSNMHSPGRQYNGVDQSVLNVTGSFLKIRSGDARVTIYGSPISNKSEFSPPTNQFLGSDSVQEDIHEFGPLDQFDICDRTILSASYVDNIVNGNMFLDNRKRVGLSSRFKNWITGSLQRNVKLVSERTYYDTLVPPAAIIATGIDGASNAVIGSDKFDPSILQIVSSSATGTFAFQNERDNNILMKRSFTYENIDSNLSQRVRNLRLALYGDNVSSADRIVSLKSPESNFALYYNGKIESIDILSTLIPKNYNGASSLRYGLLSTRIMGPSAIFRRDHFGFMRDMLEQQRDGKTIATRKGKDTISSGVVTATFVSASSDLITDAIYTQCSNLSVECTSSLPFIDDNQPHNRGNNVPVSLPTFGANNLLFGITGSFGIQ